MLGIFLPGQVKILLRLGEVHGVDAVYAFFRQGAQFLRERFVFRSGGGGSGEKTERKSGQAENVLHASLSVPRYLRSASGTATVPSARWNCSSMAGNSRLVARQEPLRGWRNSFLPVAARLKRIAPRRAW